MVLSDVIRLNVDPVIPPIWIVFGIATDQLQSVLVGEKILVVC